MFPVILFLYDNSRVFSVTPVERKETLQIHSFPVLFVLPGTIRLFIVTNVEGKKPLKYNAFLTHFHFQLV